MENNTDTSIFRTGDLVIGSTDPGKSVYSATGTKIIEHGVTVFGNSQDIASREKELAKSAIRSGGVPIRPQQIKTKKETKKKMSSAKKTTTNLGFSQDEYFARVIQHERDHAATMEEKPTPKLQTIQFENDFGKIKAKVEHIVEQDLAYMLMFTDEDNMVFEPKVGEMLALHTPDRRRVEVYYPGVTFDWPESDKKIMILFKVPAENQE